MASPLSIFMKVRSYAISVKGTVHPKEDEILVDDGRLIYAVADGVTSSSFGSGGVASQLAIYYLGKLFNHNLRETFEKTNNEICKLRLTDRSIGESTLTVAYVQDYRLDVAHVGDSSAYVVGDKTIRKITQDDSSVFGLAQVIGSTPLTINSYEEALQRNDCIILATDGITSVIEPEELLAATKETEPEKICRRVLEKVNRTPKKYDDDKSIVVVKVS
jgi:protein phosphatase